MNTEFTNRSEYPLPRDLQVFLTVVREQSFAAAARQLGQSPAYVSKRIQTLESTLSCRLLQRSTRSLKLTADGERVLPWATQVLNSLRDMQDDLSDARVSPKGRMLICSSAGFGRSYLAPAVVSTANMSNTRCRLTCRRKPPCIWCRSSNTLRTCCIPCDGCPNSV